MRRGLGLLLLSLLLLLQPGCGGSSSGYGSILIEGYWPAFLRAAAVQSGLHQQQVAGQALSLQVQVSGDGLSQALIQQATYSPTNPQTTFTLSFAIVPPGSKLVQVYLLDANNVQLASSSTTVSVVAGQSVSAALNLVVPTPTPIPATSAGATPAPGATPTPAPGATPTPAPGATPTPAPGATPTPAPGATPTPAPGATPTPAPGASATPTPSPTPTPGFQVNPSTLTFTAVGQTQTFTPSQPGYAGPFTSPTTCTSGATIVATITPASGNGPFSVTSTAGGTCSITVTGGGGMTAQVTVQVSDTSLTIN